MNVHRTARRALLGTLIGSQLAACGALDPELRADKAYLRSLMPLLQENSLLAERVLIEAAAIYNDKSDVAMLTETWTVDIVPLAEHLHSQASFVTAPEPWTDRHGELVDIWGDRARAYRSLSDAIATADSEQWKSARELADGVKLREEKWFQSVNQRVGPKGLFVDQFP